MDDLYPSLENARSFVVKSFPHNKIISFPQTVSFRDTKDGRKLLKRSRKRYSRHKDLTICVREEHSLKRVKEYFPKVKITYCPDIVLYLNETEPKIERTNILCCLRKDKEQNISSEVRDNLIAKISEKYENVLVKDTVDVALKDCQIDTYENSLKEFWAMLRSCKLVVTDRLHCMIFCAITETPCIVMDNTNKKISGVYSQWLSSADWIKMLDGYDSDLVLKLVEEALNNAPNCKIVDLENEFKPLKLACKE
jgi:pyruvyl transferase EpsI